MKDYYYEYICIAFINMLKCTKRAGELRKKNRKYFDENL